MFGKLGLKVGMDLLKVHFLKKPVSEHSFGHPELPSRSTPNLTQLSLAARKNNQFLKSVKKMKSFYVI